MGEIKLTDQFNCGPSPNTFAYIVFKRNTRTDNFEGYSLTKSATSFGFAASASDGTQDGPDAPIAPVVGQWYHLVGTFKRPILSLYINGALAGTAVHDYDLDYGTRPVFIGRTGECGGPGEADWDSYFPGTIDDVRIYNRVLSAGEVKQLYLAGK